MVAELGPTDGANLFACFLTGSGRTEQLDGSGLEMPDEQDSGGD